MIGLPTNLLNTMISSAFAKLDNVKLVGVGRLDFDLVLSSSRIKDG